MKADMDSPVGRLCLTEDGGVITAVDWGSCGREGTDDDSDVLRLAMAELTAYFAGDLVMFTVPMALGGPGFRRDVLKALINIPYGETRKYGDLARRFEVSAQAIGQACGANRIPILIPCHRVLSANGLGGYSGAGGIETKVALLKHEGAAGLLI